LFGSKDMAMWERFVCGAFAGVCSSLTVYPFELMKTRIAVTPERYAGRGLAGAFADIVREDGVAGLFRGIRPSLLGVIPYAGVDLSLYFTLRQKYADHVHAEPSPLAVLCIGAFSSLAGQTVAYPLQLARTRIQLGQGSSTLRVWRDAIAKGGPRALWRGIGPNILKAVPAVSISYVCFESVLKMTK
jgi:solute carrier family 25 phosphate transporter 23/24/25/41